MQDYQNIFDGDHHGERPDDDRQDSNEVLVGWWCWKSRGVHVERTGPNVTVDDTNGLICKPQQISTMEDLRLGEICIQCRFWIFRLHLSSFVVTRLP
jgi:hypothetical protein